MAAFAMALLSKPVAVSLPCVLLLLDFWPLGRLAIITRGKGPITVKEVAGRFFRLVLEKWPFFVLTVLVLHSDLQNPKPWQK